jgi:N-acetylmuramoyl-L-alanine amidase
MKVFAVLCSGLLLLAALPLRAQAALAGLETVTLQGRDYVSLRVWAAANDFQFRPREHGKIIALTNATTRLVFTVNSAQAEVNGVNVWLAHAVAPHPSGPSVSSFDWQTTVQPLAFPPKTTAGQKIKTIVLDPGHGGKDAGNRVGAEAEKKYTLLLAQEIRDQLKKFGIRVACTRSYDTFVELPDRPAKARKAGADLFVSLHFNATSESRAEVKGSEVYSLTPAGGYSTNARGEGNTSWVAGNRNNDKSLLLAYQIQKALQHDLHTEDRGVRRARFAVLRDATMPAVLVEAGFMSHPVEGKKIFSAAYRREMARAIVNGILAYKRQVER